MVAARFPRVTTRRGSVIEVVKSWWTGASVIVVDHAAEHEIDARLKALNGRARKARTEAVREAYRQVDRRTFVRRTADR